MLCVTGNEARLEALAGRLARTPKDALAEVRLDLLDEPLEPALALISRHASQLIVCLRPTRQGGGYHGDEDTRLALLGRVAAHGPAYLDIEGDCSEQVLTALRAAGRRSPTAPPKLVLSWHEFSSAAASRRAAITRATTLASRAVDVLKLAVAVDDPVELLALLDLAEQLERPAVLLAMGLAGQLSRSRYARFGSPWTYVTETETASTAAGQLTLDDARQLGLPESASAPCFALVGGPQVAHSPGPRVYNALFRQQGKDWAYHAICTAQAERCFALLARLGARGLSVTMPHKLAASTYGRGDALVEEVGAANTLRFTTAGAEATNTDVAGVAEPLGRALAQLRSRRGDGTALILGAGGAARAAVTACRHLSLTPRVSARRPELARAIASETVPWTDWPACDATVLINATPLCGRASPLPEPAAPTPAGATESDRWRWPIVFDLALAAEPSTLLARAAEGGALTIAAREMWLHQAVAQLTYVGGGEVDVETLRALL